MTEFFDSDEEAFRLMHTERIERARKLGEILVRPEVREYLELLREHIKDEVRNESSRVIASLAEQYVATGSQADLAKLAEARAYTRALNIALNLAGAIRNRAEASKVVLGIGQS